MSTIEILPDTPTPAAKRKALLGSRRNTMIGAAFLGLALMSITRIITDENALTSSQTIGTSLRVMVPILMAGIAALWAERCGVLNIGIEGMMILGTWFGGYFAWQYGAWVGLAMGIVGGMLGGLIHALATVRFGVNQTISGVVMNIFAFYGARYLSDLLFVGEQGGGVSQSPPQKSSIPKFDVPFLAGGDLFGWRTPDIFGWFEKKHWFLLGDLGGIGRGLTFNVSWATAIALITVPISFWLMWRTRFGLRLRSSGEAPSAAESLGVRVIPLRYAGLIISGGCAGFGGATMAIVASSYYRQGQTQGNGFIGMAPHRCARGREFVRLLAGHQAGGQRQHPCAVPVHHVHRRRPVDFVDVSQASGRRRDGARRWRFVLHRLPDGEGSASVSDPGAALCHHTRRAGDRQPAPTPARDGRRAVPSRRDSLAQRRTCRFQTVHFQMCAYSI